VKIKKWRFGLKEPRMTIARLVNVTETRDVRRLFF